MRSYKAYLFDADGTLFDSMGLIVECNRHVLELNGYPGIGAEEIIPKVGLPLRAFYEQFFGLLSDGEYGKLRDANMEYQYAIYPRYLKLFPHVAETLQALRDAGRKLAVVTSRALESAERYLSELGILPLFHELLTPESSEKHKPDPEPAMLALSRLGADPAEALFVGDSVWDMECGHASGTDTAFVAWSATGPDTLKRLPTYTLKTMAELLE